MVICIILKVNNKKFKIIEAKSFYQRFKGLMLKKNIDYGMIFYKTNSIHTFFMKEKIDVIAINEKNEVIYKQMNLNKNKILKIKNKAKKTSIIELPNNASKKIKIGDKLTLISE